MTTVARPADAAPSAELVTLAPEPARTGRFLARATLLTAALSVAGALLGLGRDQALAHLFGAGRDTDAFLVSWTLPEFAATLLIEDGMAFVLIPAFSAALAGRQERGDRHRAGADPVRALVAASLPRLFLTLSAAMVLLIAGAPLLVSLLAPGLPQHSLAVDCTRLTATCALSFGLAGYASAALRAHRSFLTPALIYVAYNIGIITAMVVLGGRLGVRSAALGVAVGGCLMLGVQTPSLWRRLLERPADSGAAAQAKPSRTVSPTAPAHRKPTAGGTGATDRATAALPPSATGGRAARAATAHPGRTRPTAPRPTGASTAGPRTARPAPRPGAPRPRTTLTGLVPPALVATVLVFALCRQSQVLIERYLASSLPEGAISHLNYAQKVAQMPMVLSLMLCTVTFPLIARALAEGDVARARDRVERDLFLAACVVLLGAATVVACAPRLIELLFQRGAFTAADTAATASVMRVYALGLLGHTLVGALVRSYFSAGRRTWYPAAAMFAGVAATAGLGALTVGAFGARGIAAANAAGITLSALLLLGGMARHGVPIRTRHTLRALTAPLTPALCASGAGLAAARWSATPAVAVPLSCAVVVAVFALVLAASRPKETVAFLGRLTSRPGLVLPRLRTGGPATLLPRRRADSPAAKHPVPSHTPVPHPQRHRHAR